MSDVQKFLAENNQPEYRLQQFNHAYYQQLITSFDELTTWSKDLRSKLQQLPFSSLKLIKTISTPKKDTIKALFSLVRNPQAKMETVLMRHDDGRNTVCISCMVGCPVGCAFCATGQMGLKEKLTTQEIIDQILYFARWLKDKEEKVSNVVYMGMGEPMLNLDVVEESIDILINPKKVGMSQRRLTVSTAGFPSQIRQFVDDGYDQLNLAISLHAPNQELRKKIMPIAKTFSMKKLFAAIDYYVQQCNKRVSYEYILLKGVNDQDKHARELAILLRNRLAHVNLIPYNPVLGVKYEKPSKKKVLRFAQILTDRSISNSIRVTMGAEIDAACGQLAA
ncbi:MAG: 23S rRNA (adenine(2503)-C(2))-methyltransferase RlmN [Patescibacteria group bacterium]|nr:23S rRNA (adenine(2503)-C(2))-methyltransferase RlmN [Patescibacteria group bacterium]